MTHVDLWSRTKVLLKESLSQHAFETWFEPVNSIAVNDIELVLEVPNQFFFEWIETHYKKTIISTIKSEFNRNLDIKYTIAPKETAATPSEIQAHTPSPNNKKTEILKPRLNEKYCFSNYIEGSNNQFAKAAALNVAEHPGDPAFNPLVIYGGVGMGKTHLLHAIGNMIVEKKPEKRIVVASSEKFTLDFISSIQKNRTVEFSKHYRKAEVLLIDDIQFFQGKEQTQEQFFHTFNELYQAGKQIVLTADRYPGEMTRLKDRLLSRFESGLSVDIQPPDYETRVAILLEKSEQSGLDMPYDIIEFLATHIKTNIRDMESTIIRLLAYSSLSNREIDMGLVRKVVQERIGKQKTFDISIEDVIRSVSEKTKVSERDIVGKGRRKQVAEARQIAIYLTRQMLGKALVEIGVHFGGRDHSTVIHACRNIESKIETDKRIKNLTNHLKKELSFASN